MGLDMHFSPLLPVSPMLHFVAPCKRGGQGAGAGWASGVFIEAAETHGVKYIHVGANLAVEVSPA